MARRLNQQRHVEIDFAMIDDGDHMYNEHLKDLYKVSGQYVIRAMQKRPQIVRPSPSDYEEDDLLLESDVDDTIDDYDDDDEI